MLPELKPGTVRELLVVPSIGGRDVACGERPDIGRFHHFLQLLNVANDALNVHASHHAAEDVQRSNGIPSRFLRSRWTNETLAIFGLLKFTTSLR